ncbi:MAG: YqeB family protein, partial [Pseudoclavibacter sp.]
GVLEVVADLPWAWSIPIGAFLGVVGGVVLAMSIASEALQMTVATDHLEYRQENREGWIERVDVATMYPDGRDIVVLDSSGRALVRLNVESLDRSRLVRTLREYDYPWRDEDPFEAGYQRWMDGRPGFTTAEHRLIDRWQEVRRKGKARAEAEVALREADLVVRDRDGRVQVRRAGDSGYGADRRPATS